MNSILGLAGIIVIQLLFDSIVYDYICGFANLFSVAILLGGLGGMAPTRRRDIAKFGVRSTIEGTRANLLRANNGINKKRPFLEGLFLTPFV
ncbi:na+ dependent nucleoside transporter family protein [Bacillus clarus]|uniref:Na+ dependent nucleoside transporter family protein n=1 Tax=Bacillus clarus TaxID=2338372 RepID=A0A090YTA3_9BACI|nr:nucleoside transporter C-terminal domain-containing protein [Bacillus clarus]KFN01198.1 na+ dependent nucleoside transporter family protein [Bacillus clarus]